MNLGGKTVKQPAFKSRLKGFDDLLAPLSRREQHIVVLELGATTLRAGKAGDNEPQLLMPACVARSAIENKNDLTQTRPADLFGHKAQLAMEEKSKEFTLSYPFEDPEQNLDKIEVMLKHVFEEKLGKEPSHLDLFIVDSPSASETRQKFCEMFFETFRVQSLNFAPSPLCALLLAGQTCGLSVEVGHSSATTMPIFQGFVARHGSRQSEYAGRHASNIVARHITEKELTLTPGDQDALIRNVKEKLACVSLRYEEELAETKLLPMEERCFELPDETAIELDRTTIFNAGEVLMRPGEILGVEAPNLVDSIYQSITSVDPEMSRRMFQNVVLSGGAAQTKGLLSRVRSDLSSMFAGHPEFLGTELMIKRAPESPNSGWVGGSLLASISSIQELNIKKSEYEESDNRLGFLFQKTI